MSFQITISELTEKALAALPFSVHPREDVFKVTADGDDFGIRCAILRVRGELHLFKISKSGYKPIAQWPFPSKMAARAYASNRHLSGDLVDL